MNRSSWLGRHPYLLMGLAVAVYFVLDLLGRCLYPWEIRIALGKLPAAMQESGLQARAKDRFVARLGPLAEPGGLAGFLVVVAEMEYVFLLTVAVLAGIVAAARREGGHAGRIL